ncbi:hypothetical protein QBC35DRAFT_396448, partial [Podospora australis]
MIVDTSHDVILGQHFFAKHDIMVDCNRQRLLFPETWTPRSDWWNNIPMDEAGKLLASPEFQKDVEKREKMMDLEDRRRRDG